MLASTATGTGSLCSSAIGENAQDAIPGAERHPVKTDNFCDGSKPLQSYDLKKELDLTGRRPRNFTFSKARNTVTTRINIGFFDCFGEGLNEILQQAAADGNPFEAGNWTTIAYPFLLNFGHVEI